MKFDVILIKIARRIEMEYELMITQRYLDDEVFDIIITDYCKIIAINTR